MDCPHCGETLPESARFCLACGQKVGRNESRQVVGDSSDVSLMELPLPPDNPVDTSESLMKADEVVIYSTSTAVTIDDKRWKATVTNKRVSLSRSVGLVFPKTSRQEIDPARLKVISLREEGNFMPEHLLQLDDLVVKGRKSDLQNLCSAIQFVRSQKVTGP